MFPVNGYIDPLSKMVISQLMTPKETVRNHAVGGGINMKLLHPIIITYYVC